MGRKNSQIEVEKRIDFILENIAKGVTIRRYLSKKTQEKFNISESQFSLDLAKAYRYLMDDLKVKRKQKANEIIFRLENLYNKNYNIQDYRECREIIETIAKLYGIGKEEEKKIENKIVVTLPKPELNEGD